ncbi:4'-phosphopantetheinyl transferase superfamily protein [Sphaerisporangium sp. NPDC005289]|uniref:4'-phosphopantetheinyl transferase family protein n=1 Tax=Sphaerisporangium sp. NPDC005289 TaxID=3155247 RepID=UPI0033A8E961
MELTVLPPPVQGLRLWRVPLDQDVAARRRAWALLSPDEQASAGRFAQAGDRHRYTVARAALRTVLGQACRLHPRAVRLATSETGRPRLAPRARPGARPLDFNLSHSGDVALIALWRGTGRVGVDVEHGSALVDYAAVARSMFPAVEADRVAAARDEDRADRFLRLWTAKEAYLKALGVGIARLRDVVVRPGSVRLGADPRSAGRLWPLDVAAGCAAAVVLCPATPGLGTPDARRRGTTTRWRVSDGRP